ncbi:ankyrin repeat domain containing protein [Perkinsus marinus ATCC 50983]|uniref:Ankyrin repeat domain containing protein n=1 Tax=Perkinsus marinus (strain ATCC 50983 / TXsc) TaxID=423536 RepID=C5LDH1_PERM5|nr:ankyrin repeat domain containing protein [Perkinsus marinus ATCC 50983]EER05303.1 ankyrin repeat domain containing protein [Perkinsus marinus ATCC 50983]|eukprot:XP_002773487.1 ankyrin repeat domain containing protein [Perkinsus marinus ATCC 50983]
MVVFRRTATTSREELSTSAFTSVSAGPVHESMVQTADDMAPGVDDVGRPRLLRAALWGRADLVADLLHRGADITQSSPSGITAVHVAAMTGDAAVIRVIVEHVGPTSKDTKYLDILRKTRGVASGLAIVVGEPLTDLSALLELKDHFGRAVAGKGVRDFHRAIRRAREYGQNVWGFVNGDSEAIMEAVLPRCYKDRVKFRMRRMPIPINPDCMQGGFTALHRAACDGSVRKTKFVLASGGDVNKLCELRGWTPLQWAVYSGSLHIVACLLAHGADGNIQCLYNGHTPMHLAVLYNRPRILKALLLHECDVTKQSRSAYRVGHEGEGGNVAVLRAGSTPMHYALGLGREELAIMIVDHLNPRKLRGPTCVRDRNSRGVEHLMSILNDRGQTAADSRKSE